MIPYMLWAQFYVSQAVKGGNMMVEHALTEDAKLDLHRDRLIRAAWAKGESSPYNTSKHFDKPGRR